MITGYLHAEIITIGDELLIGQVINTNSSWLAEIFTLNGLDVRQITAVSDDGSEIKRALKEATDRADIIILTGGLGPTKDDITKDILCEFFDDHLVFNQKVYSDVESFFLKKGVSMTEKNKLQAQVPSKAVVLDNPVGTAPGLLFRDKGKTFVALPGVPYEMKFLTENYIIPEILKINAGKIIVHKTILTQGIGESFLADKIEDWVESLPAQVKLAYLPSPGIVRLRLTMTGKDRKVMEKVLNEKTEQLKQLIPYYFWGIDKQKLEEVIGDLLRKHHLTLSTAESCTGGYVAHRITSVAGSSKYFNGSVVAYHNNVKMNLLQVSPDALSVKGAVSKEVVEQMAKGVCKALNTDIGVATSGVAGPDGGTEEKPVGTVWIAIAFEDQVVSKKFSFGDLRDRNIVRSGNAALGMLRNVLIKKRGQV